MLDLREFRRVPDRISDLLPWAALVAPEVVLNKDGSFMSTIRFRGPDLDSSTAEELVVKAAHINHTLHRLGSGWAIFAEAQRSPSNSYPDSNFPDPLTQLLDDRRRRRFQSNCHFESAFYLSLVYLPPSDTTTRLAGFFLNTSKAKALDYTLLLDAFRAEVSRTCDLLSKTMPEAFVLSEGDLLTYLHSTVSEWRHFVSVPETPMYLDSLLSDTSLVGGFYPKLGESHLSVLAVLGFPGASQPGLLDMVNRLSVSNRWVTRFVCLDKVEAKRELEAYQRKWFAKRKGIVALIKELLTKDESAISDMDALQKADDSAAALTELGTDDVSFGYYTGSFVVTASSEEELRAKTSEVERAINGAGFSTRIETVNAVDAWLATIPGNTRNNVRRPLLNTLNLSHLLPGASAVWGGQDWNNHLDAPALLTAETAGSTPFRLSLHVGDVGHTLILGPTGSGKSTFLSFIEAQFLRYPNAQVYIFDKGLSALTLTTGVGGEHYNLGSQESDLCFQPLSHVDNEAEQKWAHEWLIAIAEKENVTVTPEVKRSLWDALNALAATPRAQRTIHALTVYLQSIELRTAFEPFTERGPYGGLLDNDHDNLHYAKWQCFEMERLMETPSVVGPTLAYLFHRLERCFNGSPTLLVMDEAWLFLDHPAFSAKIREWLKTLRKQNVSVVFATQSLADVDTSSIAPTIREACFTKIYLPNAVALQADAAVFYRKFGLNERQIEILAFSTPKQDYYYTSPLGNRLLNLSLDCLSLAYCSGVSKEQVSLVLELKRCSSSANEFNSRYLEKKGFSREAAGFSKLNQTGAAA